MSNRRRMIQSRDDEDAREAQKVDARILGCLASLATGDAIGKQTETLSREGVLQWYPRGVSGFEGQPGTVIPRYAGNSKRQWLIGETTDDTERTLAVARAILRDRAVRHVTVGEELLTCTKCVHPGLQSLWQFHQAGDPARVTGDHDGCGAAVRVAPVGILFRSHRIDAIVEGAREASISTHGGPLALAAAAATAAAVSASLDAANGEEILAFAAHAAERAEWQRRSSSPTVFAQAMRTIYDDLRRMPRLSAAEVAARHFPNGPLTIVPLALTLAILMDSAEEAILLATNIGGDSDSVASIAGTILGARYPETVNDAWCRTVESVNGHNLVAVAEALGSLRA